jgi:hypothetical protein
MLIDNVCNFCIKHQLQFYPKQRLCKKNGIFPANVLNRALAGTIPALNSNTTFKRNTSPLSSTQSNTRRDAQFFRNFREKLKIQLQSKRRLSCLNMPKQKSKPEVANKRARSRSVQEITEVIEVASSSEDSPRPVKPRIAPAASPRRKSGRKVTLVPGTAARPSRKSTRVKPKRKKKPPTPSPTTTESESDSPAVTPRRKSSLSDVRPNSVLSDRLVGLRSERPSRSRSPRIERRSPQQSTSDGRTTRRPGRKRSPSPPKRRTHWHSSPQHRSSSGSPKDRTPLGSRLDYEPSNADTTITNADDNSLDGNIEGLDEDLPKFHPLRVAVNATGLSTEYPPDLRYCIRNVGTKSRNLQRQMTAHLSGANSDIEAPIEAADSERGYKVQDWIPNRETVMKKLFMTRWQEPPRVVRIPLIEGPPPSQDYYAECELSKLGFQELPGCNKAVFYEDLVGMPILIRILMYIRGDVLIVGARQDHGPRLENDNRPESDRVGAIFRAIRDDYMRLTCLWDLGPPESIALAFHPQLFDDGVLLTASGGIPGCPTSLTQTQREECKKSAENLAGFMAELQRERMRHRGENMANEEPREGQMFASNDLRLAASEFGRDCNGLEPLPRFAVQLFKKVFSPPDEQDEEQVDEMGDLMDQMDAIIQNKEVTVAPPKPLVLPPPKPRDPGTNCVEVRAFIRDQKRGGRRDPDGPKCPNATCAVGSPFIRNLEDGDNLRPDFPPYKRVTFKNAGTRSRMGEGPHDLRKFGAHTFWHLDLTTTWPPIEADMKKKGFEESCREHAVITMDTEDYIHGDLGKNHPGHRKGGATKQIKNPYRTFTAVTFGSPDGGILVVHCNYNGRSYDGPKIPKMIQDLLLDPDIFVLQFGIETDIDRLAAGGVIVNGWVDAANLTMIAYPQPEIAHVNNM